MPGHGLRAVVGLERTRLITPSQTTQRFVPDRTKGEQSMTNARTGDSFGPNVLVPERLFGKRSSTDHWLFDTFSHSDELSLSRGVAAGAGVATGSVATTGAVAVCASCCCYGRRRARNKR